MKRSKQGFTIAEVLIGSGVLFLAVMAWVQTTGQLSDISRRGESNFQLAVEQRALSGLINAMSKRSAQMALCELPHPWGSFDSTNNDCKPLATNVPDSLMQSWRQLSQAVLEWPNQSRVTQDSLDPKLDRAYYTSKIVPLMRSAGCLRCHAGDAPKKYQLPSEFDSEDAPKLIDAGTMNSNYPQIAQRDFTRVEHMIDPFAYKTVQNGVTTVVPPSDTEPGTQPLATRAILTSALGGAALTGRFQMANVLANSRSTTNYVTFTTSKVKIEMQPYRRVGRFRDNWRCTSALPNPAPRGPCEANELYQAFSCVETCVSWRPPPVCSCGKGCWRVCGKATCSQYRSNFTCMSTSDDSTVVMDSIPQSSYTTGATYAPTSWQTISDSYCANAPASLGGPWCGGTVCASGSDVDQCIKPGSCQRICTTPTWRSGYSCGKNCYRPPRVNGCTTQSLQYVCKTALLVNTISKDVLSYSIDSEFFDSQMKSYKHITTQGVMQ